MMIETIKNTMGHKIHRPHLKTASDARAVRTREALRIALLRLLELQTFEQVTIRDICAKASVGYTTFFRHHPSKESLLDDVAAEQIGQLVGLSLPVAQTVGTRSASIALFTYVDEHRKLWSTLLTGGAASAMRAEFLRVSMEIAAAQGRRDAWPPADIATILVVSSTIELLSWWLRQRKPLSIEKVAEIHEAIIVTPTVGSVKELTAKAERKVRVR